MFLQRLPLANFYGLSYSLCLYCCQFHCWETNTILVAVPKKLVVNNWGKLESLKYFSNFQILVGDLNIICKDIIPSELLLRHRNFKVDLLMILLFFLVKFRSSLFSCPNNSRTFPSQEKFRSSLFASLDLRGILKIARDARLTNQSIISRRLVSEFKYDTRIIFFLGNFYQVYFKLLLNWSTCKTPAIIKLSTCIKPTGRHTKAIFPFNRYSS